MNQSDENVNTKPGISIEGKMSEQDAGKVAIIMAIGKSTSLILASLGAVITAVALLIWRISG